MYILVIIITWATAEFNVDIHVTVNNKYNSYEDCMYNGDKLSHSTNITDNVKGTNAKIEWKCNK